MLVDKSLPQRLLLATTSCRYLIVPSMALFPRHDPPWCLNSTALLVPDPSAPSTTSPSIGWLYSSLCNNFVIDQFHWSMPWFFAQWPLSPRDGDLISAAIFLMSPGQTYAQSLLLSCPLWHLVSTCWLLIAIVLRGVGLTLSTNSRTTCSLPPLHLMQYSMSCALKSAANSYVSIVAARIFAQTPTSAPYACALTCFFQDGKFSSTYSFDYSKVANAALLFMLLLIDIRFEPDIGLVIANVPHCLDIITLNFLFVEVCVAFVGSASKRLWCLLHLVVSVRLHDMVVIRS